MCGTTIRGNAPCLPELVTDTDTHSRMKKTAKWRLGLKKAVQAWMDNDDYVRDLIAASDLLLANKGHLLPQNLLARTNFESLLGTSLMPSLIQAMKEDMKPEIDCLVVSAISKVYSEGSNVARIATFSDLKKEMQECAGTHIFNTFTVAPWELPASMQEQLTSELKEARCEEIRDVQSKLVYLRRVMHQISRRSQSNETAQESEDSGSMSSWDFSEAANAE